MNRTILILVLAIIFAGCQSTFNSYQDFQAFAQDPDNGLTKVKKYGDKYVKISYLHDEYFKNQSIKKGVPLSELKDVHNKHFLISIGYNDSQKNILFDGLMDEKEYEERLDKLNFELSKYISMNCGGIEYKPVLFNFQNTYGLEQEANVLVIFSPQNEKEELLNAEEYELVFSDEIFYTGLSKFKFSGADINKEFNILKT